MRNVLISIVLLACVLFVKAQDITFFAMDRSVSGSICDSPTNLPGITLRWVSSDLTNNGPVQDWIDRIQSNHLVQGTSGNRPTNSSAGVHFNRLAQWLVATNISSLVGSNAYLIVMQIEHMTGSSSRMILDDNFSGGGSAVLRVLDDKPQFASFTFTPSMRTNAVTDIIASSLTTTNRYQGYTNGVSINADTALPTTTGVINWMGNKGDSGNFGLNGSIVELCIWTNKILTASQIDQLHCYATNTYGITP